MNVAVALDRWLLRPLCPGEARLRLFCLPYAGGGASAFRVWTQAIAPQIEVCPIQLPGRENRLLEAPFTDVGALVDALATALEPAIDRPFALFGHSLGALIGFELIRHFRRRGWPGPVCFFASACRAPQLPRPGEPIHALPEGAFLDALRRLKGTPERLLQDRELMQLVLPALRADFALVETYAYAPGARLDCPVAAFGGEADTTVGLADVAGWADQAGRDFSLRMLPGGHFFLNDPSTRERLTQAICQQLAPFGAEPRPRQWRRPASEGLGLGRGLPIATGTRW
jgi:medium-chain acyl-[acyl-carrier-protein] hydrolase